MSRQKVVLGAVALLVPVAAGAFLLSQRKAQTASTDSAVVATTAVAESAQVPLPQPPALPAAVPESTVVVAPVDSQAIADSAKKRAARAEAKRAAAAKADSLKQTTTTTQNSRGIRAARWAAAALLADPEAQRAFIRGSTRAGGLLGKQRRGDLQTQIDALQPFLTKNGLTYEEFKRLVAESGFNIFDQFGRMVPATLRRFASVVD